MAARIRGPSSFERPWTGDVRLLVTGGAGYLGSVVAARARARGWDVAATRFSREPPAGRSVRVDLRDEDATARAFLGLRPEVVVHTAYRQADDEVEAAVVDATRNVVRAARRAGARLIHLSTDLVFDGEREGRYAEDDEARPVSRYGEAKLAAERIVAEHPDALAVRTSLLYGKPGPQEALVLRAGVVFHTDEIRTPLPVADLAEALLELAGSELTGLLHVAGPDAVSRYELARLLAARLGRDPDELASGPAPRDAGRARNVALDSSRASGLLRTRIRGVREALHSL